MNPPLQVEGIEVRVEGQGPTLVMVHGWPDTLSLWDDTVAHLRDRFRCVRFTLPGFDVGQAPRPTRLPAMLALLSRIIDTVSPDRPVTLVLHDWGCVFGYQYAARHPQRVAGIVGVDVGDTFSRAYREQLPLKARLGILAYQGWLALASGLGPLGDAMSRRLAALMQVPVPRERIARQQNYPYVMAWTGGFREAVDFQPSCPMLYLYGQRKPFMFHSKSWLVRLRAAPGSDALGLPCGHWVMVQQREAFLARVRTWLEARDSLGAAQ